jgi:fucose permease
VPFLIGGVALAGYGWRAAHVVVGCVIALFAIVLWCVEIPTELRKESTDEESPGLLATLKETLKDRVLIAWLFGVALCDLLDEILVVFATLHMRDQLGGGIAWQQAMIMAMTIGGGIGLVVLDRLLAKIAERTMLLWCASACAISFVAWIAAPWVWMSVVLMGVVGMFASPLYPLAASQAFARRPDASGSVLAAQSLFSPMGLALPFLIGLIADRAGTYVALLVLIAQPVGLIALVMFGGGARRSKAHAAPTDAPATPPPASEPPA